MPIAPTLILGLGGTGSKIVERVAEKVKESNSAQSDRIAFVAFDTDVNDLGRIRQQSPAIYTVQTSTRNTVGEYLNVNTNARDNWFPVNEMLNRKTLTEGAAQVRAISRLAFDTTLKAGNLEPLHQAIEELFRIDKDQEEQTLRVIITSSLAGGTGSGLILSVAMYLANYLRTKYPKAKAITRGFFIQPDVFSTIITGTEEQQNLRVNAYAAVRELDAFLMKGDNTLPAQYRGLKFEFPRVGAEGVEEVHAMPYDFCFLFDSNNSSGGSLDAFATYLDHAATCIYTQSIGPMAKKSNSREDNVLREIIKNDGRNRYASAGASRLVYPWQHVRDVVANQWANLALSTQWLQFDDQFRGRQEGLAQQRAKGHAARDLDLPTEFIAAVDAAAQNKEPFARAIQGQCLAYDEEGISVIGNRWLEYLSALKKHVVSGAVVASDEAFMRNVQARIAELADTADGDEYVAAYYDLKKYHDLVERHTEDTAGVLGYSLFHTEGTVTKDRHAHQLETYLRDKVTGGFVHPVSARYFLYQTLQALKTEKQVVQTELERLERFFEQFEAAAFGNPETDGVEGVSDFGLRKKSLSERMRGKPGPELQELADQFRNYVRNVGELRERSVYASVLEDGILYVTGLAKSFETFFVSLRGNLKRLRTAIDLARTRYDGLTGSTTRYVLASSTCLDALYRTMPYTGGVVSVDSNLSEAIYGKVRQYHMLTDVKDGNYFQDLYTNTILTYFADQVMEGYGPQLMVDIIEALEREYRTIANNFEEANVEHYVTTEIEKAKRLAAPFLEQPLGDDRHPIEACAYSPAIEGDSDPKRKSLIEQNLGNYGGERDDEISPQEILFYNALYGIRARDLSKYSAERDHATVKRPAGAYFTAYYRLVSEIQPAVGQTKVITPHVDRRWHSISELPDLDEESQSRQLAGIHSALLGGLAYEQISMNEQGLYRYRGANSLKDESFVVSNGTPCDQFYEVVDGLTINPIAVATINESVRRTVQKERQSRRSITFAQSRLGRALDEGIDLQELVSVDPAFIEKDATIFDIAALYALSRPKDQYSEDELVVLSSNMLSYLCDAIASMSDEEVDLPTLEQVLATQFERFQDNAGLYLESQREGFAAKIRAILRPLGNVLEQYSELNELNEAVHAFDRALRKGTMLENSKRVGSAPTPGARITA